MFLILGELSDDSWRLGRHSGENKPLHQSTGARDIKIEYKDEFGRVLGPKDAFRYISWAFHGKGPGKKKREKLLRKIETGRLKNENAGKLSSISGLCCCKVSDMYRGCEIIPML